MSSDLEDTVRATLVDHAPSSVPPADWATLRARAARRTAAGRAAVVLGAAAAGTLAVTTAGTTEPAVFGPAAVTPQQTVEPTETLAPGQPVASLDPGVVDTALTYERVFETEWSTGPAVRGTIEQALGTLMASPQVTDPSTQPLVIWSSASNTGDGSQRSQVLVAVERSGGWVLGFWDERAPYGSWVDAMSFGTMPGGPIEDRLVGFVLPEESYANRGGLHVVYAPPVAAVRVTAMFSQAAIDAAPPRTDGKLMGTDADTEVDLDAGFGQYGFAYAPTIRAYAADGTLLDEQTYGE